MRSGTALVIGTDDQACHDTPSHQGLTQSKASTFRGSVKAEGGREAAEEKLGARRGGFMQFKERSTSQGAAGADGEAAASQQIWLSHEGDYVQQQTFSVDGTAFCRERKPAGIFTAREGRSVSGFNSQVSG